MSKLASYHTIVFVTLIVFLLIFLITGYVCGRKLKHKSIADYFLAGRQLGSLVLVFTLFATQYSGITFIGFVSKAYQHGFSWLFISLMLTAVIVCYLMYAPKLKLIAQKRKFITPVDYLRFRYHSPALNFIASLVMVYALSNYLITQLMILGRIGESLSLTHITYSWYVGSICLFAVVMFIYESMGGMLAVAWTDMIQGLIMFVGLYLAFWIITQHHGGITHILHLASTTSRLHKLIALPNAATCRSWMSYILLVGLGASIYPQAIQRIFAAKDMKAMCYSFKYMLFFPLLLTIPVILIGITAAVYLPNLKGVQTEQVIFRMLLQLGQNDLPAQIVMVVFFGALLAAILSTADSVLLSLTSITVKDLLAVKSRSIQPERILRLSKLTSGIILGLFVLISIMLHNTTIIKMLDIKFDILIQLVPAFYLGLHFKNITAKSILTGLLISLIVVILGNLSGYAKIASIHIGIYGLVLNLLYIIIHTFFTASCDQQHEHHEQDLIF